MPLSYSLSMRIRGGGHPELEATHLPFLWDIFFCVKTYVYSKAIKSIICILQLFEINALKVACLKNFVQQTVIYFSFTRPYRYFIEVKYPVVISSSKHVES